MIRTAFAYDFTLLNVHLDTHVLAPSNTNQPTQTKMQQFQKKALNYLCGTSVENEILSSAVDGAVTGGVTGALEGGVGGAVFGEGIGAIPGAGLGAFAGGVFGATFGIIKGSEMAAVCYVFHVY